MGNPVVATAICQCTFGVAPAPMNVTSQMTVTAQNFLVGTIMDTPKLPMTFGMCSSPINPAVVAATAASRGWIIPPPVVPPFIPPTPAPCVPACPAPWVPGSVTVLVGGKPALNTTCKCTCAYGGLISVNMTPAMTVQIP